MQGPPKPMLATLASKIPTGAGWSYEVKWDGYRTIAVKDRERVALYSRNLKDFTKTYASISAAVARIPTTSVMLDGEVVAIDEDGRPSFQALHHSTPHALAYYVFDVLHVNGRYLLGAPLAERRAALSRLALEPPVLRSDPLPGTPSQIEDAVRSLGLEGLVAKRVDSRSERRAALSRLALEPPVLRSDPLPGTPSQIEDAVRSLGLEGLVAKRVDS